MNQIDYDDDVSFTLLVRATLCDDLTRQLDNLIVSKKLTFTQKQTIQNLRDKGVIDSIIIGNYKSVTVDDLIELFTVFHRGFILRPLTKEDYKYNNVHTCVTTTH